MSRRSLCLVSTTLFVSLIAAASPHASADPAVYEPATDPAVGFNLIQWYNFGPGGESVWEDSIDSLHAAGFREVAISPVRFVDITSGHILSSSPKGAETSHILAAVVRAKSYGMRVTMNPFVELMNPHGPGDGDDEYFANFNGIGTWRGYFNLGAAAPGNAVFWSDYTNYMTEMAAIAQTHGVEAMTIGTEYNALNQDNDQLPNWAAAIDAIDAAYSGKIGYASNWDMYRHPNVQALWDNPKVDFIGIDAYFSYHQDPLVQYLQFQNPGLSQQDALTQARAAADSADTNQFRDLMTAAWSHKLNNEILAYAGERKGGAGMPVQFTEVGYLPYNYTSVDPQQYFIGGQPLDDDEQIIAFQSLIRALDGLRAEFQAMDIWQWGIGGSNGSQWNIATSSDLDPDQPTNVPLGDWLSAYVKTAPVPEPQSMALAAIAMAQLLGRRRPRGPILCCDNSSSAKLVEEDE